MQARVRFGSRDRFCARSGSAFPLGPLPFAGLPLPRFLFQQIGLRYLQNAVQRIAQPLRWRVAGYVRGRWQRSHAGIIAPA